MTQWLSIWAQLSWTSGVPWDHTEVCSHIEISGTGWSKMVFFPGWVVDAGCQLGHVSSRLNLGLFTGRQCSKRVRTETEPWDWKSHTQYHFCHVLTVKVNHKASLIKYLLREAEKNLWPFKISCNELNTFHSPFNGHIISNQILTWQCSFGESWLNYWEFDFWNVFNCCYTCLMTISDLRSYLKFVNLWLNLCFNALVYCICRNCLSEPVPDERIFRGKWLSGPSQQQGLWLMPSGSGSHFQKQVTSSPYLVAKVIDFVRKSKICSFQNANKCQILYCSWGRPRSLGDKCNSLQGKDQPFIVF